ncbi:potassium channel family protein [Alteromonas sp. ALT199]|uniref:potassium channel family protein n=1 Tax=unclassified Alteromonas TaxID=2614992 RepID=UPI001BE7F290|nr:potassium channel family protein [Alteromonas sp. ALT199]MBT3137219.1 potassium channel family protein [Alteromonas sp. ALT199]
MIKFLKKKLKESELFQLFSNDNEYRSLVLGLTIICIFFWATAWWSPWPFIVINIISAFLGKGAFTGWGDTIKRWHQPDCHPKFIALTVFTVLILSIKLFAALYMLGKVADSNGNIISSVWDHVYFSTVTVTTLGYGNIVPANTFTEVVASIQAIIGFSGFAALTGVVVSVAYRRTAGG